MCVVHDFLFTYKPYICLRIAKAQTIIKLFVSAFFVMMNSGLIGSFILFFLILMFSQSGLTSLHLAAQEDKVGVGEILVKHGANVDQQTKVRRLLLYPKVRHFSQ